MRAAVESVEQKRELERLARETRDAVRLLSETGGVSLSVRWTRRSFSRSIWLRRAGDTEQSLGLRELLVNAVEHGNLGITYDEKGALIEKWIGLGRVRSDRLSLPEYRDRRVEVRARTGAAKRSQVTIKDEGPEDSISKRYKTIQEERLFDSHGRGVLVATSMLDVEYQSHRESRSKCDSQPR